MAQDIEEIHHYNSNNTDDANFVVNKSNVIKNNISNPSNIIPETKTIYIKTWGCSHNISDSEYMSGLLSSFGYNIIINEDKSDDADLWILNSCTVKGPSQEHFIGFVKKGKLKNKLIVAAGCVPQGDKKLNIINDISIIGVQQIDRVVDVVKETFRGNIVKLFNEKKIQNINGKNKRKDGGAKLNLPKIRKNKLIEIIPINTGCLNQCTYCKTKHARGDLGSYTINEILNRIKYVINEGIIREIWLTSEDTGAYGIDIGTSIDILLNEICNLLNDPQYFNKIMIRLGMSNPPYIMQHLKSLSLALNHPNIYSFLHIPVQSGSNRILYKMKRKYTINDFITVCDYLIKSVPRIHIATDFICGFPTETNEDHNKSLNILNKYKFITLNISQFYPRPSTPAAKMKKLNTKIVKSRSREMTKLFKSYTSWDNYIGEIHNVLITEIAKDGYHFVGHNKSFDHILVPPPGSSTDNVDLMGKIVSVKIIEIGKYYLKSKIIEISNNLKVTNGLNDLTNSNLKNNNNINISYILLISCAIISLLFYLFINI